MQTKNKTPMDRCIQELYSLPTLESGYCIWVSRTDVVKLIAILVERTLLQPEGKRNDD
jgi:hypothetical protein